MVDTKRIWFEEGFKAGQKELLEKLKKDYSIKCNDENYASFSVKEWLEEFNL